LHNDTIFGIKSIGHRVSGRGTSRFARLTPLLKNPRFLNSRLYVYTLANQGSAEGRFLYFPRRGNRRVVDTHSRPLSDMGLLNYSLFLRNSFIIWQSSINCRSCRFQILSGPFIFSNDPGLANYFRGFSFLR